ncbi:MULTISPECIES: hypothetical protein [Lachnospiraceae]|uniref:hypothetical protein n=1 Tax=Lachnospiraceae TaxID=186803 RepID=UPI0003B77E16|nr:MULTISPECIES: hypothetical protein [Lachnospiraceae]
MQKVKKASYNQLKEVLEEMYDHIHSQDQDIKYLSNENQYLSDYIKWKGLTEDFEYFKAHAHKVHLDEDLPFENYVL